MKRLFSICMTRRKISYFCQLGLVPKLQRNSIPVEMSIDDSWTVKSTWHGPQLLLQEECFKLQALEGQGGLLLQMALFYIYIYIYIKEEDIQVLFWGSFMVAGMISNWFSRQNCWSGTARQIACRLPKLR